MEDKEIKTPWIDYKRSIAIDKATSSIRIKIVISVKVDTIAPKDYPKFKKAMIEIDKANREEFYFLLGKTE